MKNTYLIFKHQLNGSLFADGLSKEFNTFGIIEIPAMAAFMKRMHSEEKLGPRDSDTELIFPKEGKIKFLGDNPVGLLPLTPDEMLEFMENMGK